MIMLMSLLGMGIIGIPFVVIVLISILIAMAYFSYLLVLIIKYRTELRIKSVKNYFVNENYDVPNYEPSVMAYLVNCQKIGRREICSTLFDLIGRGYISITLKYDLVSSNKSEYIFTFKKKNCEKLEKFEVLMLNYIFEESDVITSKDLNLKLYKRNLNEEFYLEFLKAIQEKSKKKEFFDAKIAKKKVKIYKIVDKFVTIIASIMTFLISLIEVIDDVDSEGFILSIVMFSIITAGVLWCLKFLISFMYNLTCFYNDFSEKGSEDYTKWMGFKKYLKNCSTIPDHPLMGVMVWERYYAYAIGLKCSKKFFKQMKKLKIVDNSIDIQMFESFNDLVSTIGTSAKRIKSISIDRYGGSHVNY